MVASILGISRLRIGTDGNGITSLVAFHGCSLRCQYCLNPACLDCDAKVQRMTPEEVMKELKKDELYYIATKGGVTLGGGEPLLKSQFIKELLDLGVTHVLTKNQYPLIWGDIQWNKWKTSDGFYIYEIEDSKQ